MWFAEKKGFSVNVSGTSCATLAASPLLLADSNSHSQTADTKHGT